VGVHPPDARARALVVGAGPGQLGLLAAAKKRGIPVVVCDRDDQALGLRLAERHALVSTEDEAGIELVAREEEVEGLIAPGIDAPVAIAARVAARLGLQHPLDPATAEIAVSKHLQRERFDAAGVPQPRWELATDPGHEPSLPLPLVVKPADRQGQVAVSVVSSPDELAPALEAAISASPSGEALVEELVEGPEVTVNAFSVGGVFHALTVTDRFTADPPAFGVALAHVWPSEQDVEPVIAVAKAAAEAVGVREGPTYTQLRIDADGPKVMELAARLGGGHDAELCEAALGIDLNALALGVALGRSVRIPEPRPAGGACVRFLVAPPGVLAGVDGLREALEVPGVLDAVPYRPPGWEFGILRTGHDRAGFVLARGDSREDALARAEEAAARITFRG
jgi:biotin carboxylase